MENFQKNKEKYEKKIRDLIESGYYSFFSGNTNVFSSKIDEIIEILELNDYYESKNEYENKKEKRNLFVKAMSRNDLKVQIFYNERNFESFMQNRKKEFLDLLCYTFSSYKIPMFKKLAKEIDIDFSVLDEIESKSEKIKDYERYFFIGISNIVYFDDFYFKINPEMKENILEDLSKKKGSLKKIKNNMEMFNKSIEMIKHKNKLLEITNYMISSIKDQKKLEKVQDLNLSLSAENFEKIIDHKKYDTDKRVAFLITKKHIKNVAKSLLKLKDDNIKFRKELEEIKGESVFDYIKGFFSKKM